MSTAGSDANGAPHEDPKDPATKIRNDAVEQKVISLSSEHQVISTVVHEQNIYMGLREATPATEPIDELPEHLPTLPAALHPFTDPSHDTLVNRLETRRLLLLSSYRETAAYSAAYSLVADRRFVDQQKRSFYPAGNRLRERLDVDILWLTKAEILQVPQIILIDIGRQCTFLESVLSLALSHQARIRDTLADRQSYVVLAVDELLLPNDQIAANELCRSVGVHGVDHLQYLFSGMPTAARRPDLEARLLACVNNGTWPDGRGELYERVADLLVKSREKLEAFVTELEKAGGRSAAVWFQQLQTVRPEEVFKGESEAHRATAFVAAYFPDLGQREFQRFVELVLGDATLTIERSRDVVGPDGAVRTVRDSHEQRYIDRWYGDADRLFDECRIHMVASKEGYQVVEFSEPYLRRELRAHLERRHSWYVLRTCERLQSSGVLFASDLSQTAVDALVRLFVDRAVADPTSFGPAWLVHLVLSVHGQLTRQVPDGTLEDKIAWLVDQLAAEAVLRAHFHARLALLIREMLDREPLRQMVRGFFQFLISVGRHDAVIGVVLTLARRLRFAPHFSPLAWMRLLLDQGTLEIRGHAESGIFGLTEDSGPGIFTMLAAIHGWLPEGERPVERFSPSNRFSVDFVYGFSLHVARRLPRERFGSWPSPHPLFGGLAGNGTEAREQVEFLVRWLLDARGVELEGAAPDDPLRPAGVRRMDRLADLVEHWGWVLEGADRAGPEEGRAVFQTVLEELAAQTSEPQRMWLTRCWQRRRDEQMAAASGVAAADRRTAVRRQLKLDDIRGRLVSLAGGPRRRVV